MIDERFVNRVELAHILGVSLRQIDAFVREGMPSETWGMQHFRRFLPSECIEWARQRERAVS